MSEETTPQDDKAMSPASAGSRQQDITARLRRWAHSVDAVSASDIMDEAAGVIEKLRRRLRLSDAAVRSQPTLTDAEREAIEWATEEAKRIADAAWFGDASLERRWVALRLLARRLG
jgi:hypothetical protein